MEGLEINSNEQLDGQDGGVERRAEVLTRAAIKEVIGSFDIPTAVDGFETSDTRGLQI